MYPFFRALLFRLDPETAHQLTLQLMRICGVEPIHSILRAIYSAPSKPVNAFGLIFKNPIGLAAGYDKDAVAIKGLSTLGFGHLEVGTVTLKPQPGNLRPRVFRLPEDEAIINRMGFPGRGADFVAMSLRGVALKAPRRGNLPTPEETLDLLSKSPGAHLPRMWSPTMPGSAGVASTGLDTAKVTPTRPLPARNDIIIGINLGKNKDTPLEDAASDYIALMRQFRHLADYLTINISSPNTIGLRRLQGRGLLENLLGQINVERAAWNLECPILVKLAPDLSNEELDDAIEVILDKNMDGILATNTTLRRERLRSKYQGELGGLSGRPLRSRSEAVLRQVAKRVNGKVPIVSVGGIMNPDDAKRRLDLGATLIQIYTGLIYHGPGLVKKTLVEL
ncbi:MAG: dihydroorotate dehydrogenase (quinone) [Anaerolineales bacterium]